MRNEILSGLVGVEQLLQHLPGSVAAGLSARLAELRRLLVEQRSPRLVLVGRRGAGKSSLVNAIFNEPIASIGHTGRGTLEPRWYPYRSERGSLDVLDTRGIGEARTEGESDGRAAAVSMLLDAARTSPPDALLFLVKAKEIESRTDEDVADLNKICRELGQRAGFQLPIIGVLNQCDELSPPTVRLDALDTGPRYLQKLEAVRQVEGKLFHRLTPSVVPGTRLVGTLGVVSYAEWDAQGHLIDDLRWRIPELVRVIFDQLPTEAQLELVRLSRVRKLQREVAVRVVQATSAIAAAIAAVPLPVADMAPITSAQVAMLIAIGHIAGRELSVKAATEFLVALGVNVGAGFVFREVTRQLLKWAFPGGGSAVSAAVAYAATLGLGTAAIAYFIDEKSVAEAKEAYKKTRQETENQYRPEAP